jgi:hypothetical protein
MIRIFISFTSTPIYASGIETKINQSNRVLKVPNQVFQDFEIMID